VVKINILGIFFSSITSEKKERYLNLKEFFFFIRGVVGQKENGMFLFTLTTIKSSVKNGQRRYRKREECFGRTLKRHQALFDYIHELETKIEKLSGRLDQTQLSQHLPLPKQEIAPLNQMEKKIFLTLYTEETALSSAEISARTGIALSIVPEELSALTSKGIPLIRNVCENQLFFKLDPCFKELQAKENLVNLSLQSFM